MKELIVVVIFLAGHKSLGHFYFSVPQIIHWKKLR
jgi:hypothetical protein